MAISPYGLRLSMRILLIFHRSVGFANDAEPGWRICQCISIAEYDPLVNDGYLVLCRLRGDLVLFQARARTSDVGHLRLRATIGTELYPFGSCGLP